MIKRTPNAPLTPSSCLKFCNLLTGHILQHPRPKNKAKSRLKPQSKLLQVVDECKIPCFWNFIRIIMQPILLATSNSFAPISVYCVQRCV